MADITQIKSQLAGRAESIARQLLPAGQKHGNEWCVGSIDGEKGDSLKVCISGDRAGVWADFATGQAGDLLDLACATKGCDLLAALKWASDLLGIKDLGLQRASEAGGEPRQYRKPVRPKNVMVPQSAVLDYLTVQRGIKADTLKVFQIGEIAEMQFQHKGRSFQSPAVVFPFKVGSDLVFLKYLGTVRPDPEKPKDKLIQAAAECEPVLFGWQAMPANSRSVIICEGEINAMSWHQFGASALATPFGAGKGKKHSWVASEWDRLAQFETIYLNFDPDPAGREAIADLVERLGRHRCVVVPPMPDGYKDANDCLFAGVSADAMKALLENSEACDPEQLRRASAYQDAVIDLFYPTADAHKGCPIPIAGYGDKIRLRRGEFTLMTGKRGHGKTEAINQIINSVIASGERACVASFETKAPKLLKHAIKQATAQREPSREYIKQVLTQYHDTFWIFDHVGRANKQTIFEVFEYAYRRYGVTFFVIDSLMKCGINGDDYNAQDSIANDCANFANRFNVHLLMVAHARKEGGEENPPRNDSVKGAGGLTDQASNVLAVWRNKAKERAMHKMQIREPLMRDEENALNEPDGIWVLDKQREDDGWIGDIPVWFDPDSKQFFGKGQKVEPIFPFLTGGEYAPSYYEPQSEDDYVPVF